MDDITIRLDRLEKLIKSQNLLQKEAFTIEETAFYIGISMSHLYKMTSAKSIPHYKPTGGKIYFSRQELDQWLLSNKIEERPSIDQLADEYMEKHRRIDL